MKNKILIIMIILITCGLISWSAINFIRKSPTTPTSQINQEKKLEIVSTNPDPLDEATILPTQNIEITFNKPLVRSEFKYKLDPETAHQLTVVEGNGPNKDIGQTFKITFNKPLELGRGYTLFVLPGTHTEDGLKFDKDQNFTFHTINYRGI